MAKKPMSIKFDVELLDLISRASDATHLSQVETIRQALRLGLPRLVAEYPRPEKMGFVMSPELAAEIETSEASSRATDYSTDQLRKRLLRK